MLHGTIDKNCDLQREYTGDKGAPDILHRVDNQRGHPYYDTMVCKMIAKQKPICIEDYIEIAQELRKLIENSGEYALDYIPP